MKRQSVYAAILFGVMGLTATGTQARAQDQPLQKMPRVGQMPGMMAQVSTPAGPLQISYGGKTATWTVETLAALPHKTITVHNEYTNADETYSGVQLIDLLMPMGVNAQPHGKDLNLYVAAAGSDGYAVVYGIGEVTPDVHDATVIVADSENGRPLTDDGPLKLVATGEKRPARWVRNLVSIRVQAPE